jgi:integrase
VKQIERAHDLGAIARPDTVRTLRSQCFMKGITMATIDTRVASNGKITYRARARLKGYPQDTASFSRKTDARKWAEGVEAAMREGRYFTTNEAKRHTLAELVERYEWDILPLKPKAAYNRRQQLGWWKTQLGDYRLSEVTPAKIVECRDRLLNTPRLNRKRRSNSTVVRYLAALSHAFSVAMKEWGWVEDNPLRKVTKPKEPRGRIRCLEENDRKTLLQACSTSTSAHLYPVVVLAISTGMRKGEILGLHWSQVDLVRERITLHETKNGDRRGVPLAGLALTLLRALSTDRRTDTELVFSSSLVARPIQLKKAWKTALRKAGINDFRFHDLRHCAASYLVMNGASLPEVGEILGQRSVQMTKRYAHIVEGHSKRIVTAMNEQIFKQAVAG